MHRLVLTYSTKVENHFKDQSIDQHKGYFFLCHQESCKDSKYGGVATFSGVSFSHDVIASCLIQWQLWAHYRRKHEEYSREQFKEFEPYINADSKR